MLVLAIVVFGFGLYFAGQLFTKANELKSSMDKNTETQLESLMDQGLSVAFPVQSKDTTDGTATFGLGIINQLSGQRNFTVEVNCITVTDSSGESELSDAKAQCDLSKVLITPSSFGLEKNGKQKVLIAVKTGNKRGIYEFSAAVKFKESDGSYSPYGDSSKQFYVTLN